MAKKSGKSSKNRFQYIGPSPKSERAKNYYQLGKKPNAFQGKGFDGNPNSSLTTMTPKDKKSYGRARRGK